ncbi:MAG: hypothetical protein ACI92I_000643 [Acidimicrobiales bacterium]|jgi:hypothetical protein
MKLDGGDLGRIEKEEVIEHQAIGTAERYLSRHVNQKISVSNSANVLDNVIMVSGTFYASIATWEECQE